MIQLLAAMPGAIAQGLIWGVMAIGVYITYKVLDIADLTVDGSICTGAAVCTVLLLDGRSIWLAMLCAVLAGILAGTVTGLLHVLLGIPPILSGILTQMVLWSVNLKILGKANQALPARSLKVLLSQMDIAGALPVLLAVCMVLGAVIYYIVYQIIIFAGFDTDLLKMFSAIVVAVFLGVPYLKQEMKARIRAGKGGSGYAENE